MEILYFAGRYCPPCETMKKRVQKFTEENDVSFYVFQVDDPYGGYSKRKEYGVKQIPTAVLLGDDGAEIARITGLETAAKIKKSFKAAVKEVSSEQSLLGLGFIRVVPQKDLSTSLRLVPLS